MSETASTAAQTLFALPPFFWPRRPQRAGEPGPTAMACGQGVAANPAVPSLKELRGPGALGLFAGESLPAEHDHITIKSLYFHQEGAPARMLCGDHR